MRTKGILALLMTIAGIVGGAICVSIIMSAYRSSGHAAVSTSRLTYAFTEFEHPHKVLIVGGFILSLVVGFTGLFLGMRHIGQYMRAANKGPRS